MPYESTLSYYQEDDIQSESSVPFIRPSSSWSFEWQSSLPSSYPAYNLPFVSNSVEEHELDLLEHSAHFISIQRSNSEMNNINDSIFFEANNSLANDIPEYPRIKRLAEMTLTFRTITIIIYSLTAIVAFIANLLAIIILNRNRRTSRQLNLFLSNLGFSDIIFATFNIPFTYITLVYHTWWLPEFLCPLATFVQVLAPTVAFYTLITIGVGRYLVIVSGKKSLFLTKSSHTKIVIAGLWIMAGLVASPILITTKISPVMFQNETHVECTEDWSILDPTDSNSIGVIYTIVLFVLTFILPVVALTYLYGHIGIIVYKHQLPTGNDNLVINRNLTQTKVKVLKMLLILVVSFIICWSPGQIFYLLLWIFEDIRDDGNNRHEDDKNRPDSTTTSDSTANTTNYYSIFYYTIYVLFHWLSCSHTIINPFIYCFFSNNFQIKDLSNIICCKFNRSSHSKSSSRPRSSSMQRSVRWLNNNTTHSNNNSPSTLCHYHHNHNNIQNKNNENMINMDEYSIHPPNDQHKNGNIDQNSNNNKTEECSTLKQTRSTSPTNDSIIIFKHSSNFQTCQI